MADEISVETIDAPFGYVE